MRAGLRVYVEQRRCRSKPRAQSSEERFTRPELKRIWVCASVRPSVCPAGDVVCSLALSHMGRVIRL